MTRIGEKIQCSEVFGGETREGKRMLVRPRSSWKDDIKKSIKKCVAMP